MRQSAIILLTLLVLLITACGTGGVAPLSSPHREPGIGGQTLILGELEAIARDPDLSQDEKRRRFQDMGIEDPDLIDALLQL